MRPGACRQTVKRRRMGVAPQRRHGGPVSQKYRRFPHKKKRGQTHIPRTTGKCACPFRYLDYSSFATTTVISTGTSLCSRTVTLYSPNCRMGSSSTILRRSML